MSDQIPRSSRALDEDRTVVPAGHFDELLRELDRPPVPNRRTAEAAKRARVVLHGLREPAAARPFGCDHELLRAPEPLDLRCPRCGGEIATEDIGAFCSGNLGDQHGCGLRWDAQGHFMGEAL
jgi:hypothetical protein